MKKQRFKFLATEDVFKPPIINRYFANADVVKKSAKINANH